MPARRPLAAGDAGLEIGYPEKICHHDDDGRRTTYDGQKITPLIVGAQFSFWSFFIDFELMSIFFAAQEKGSRQIVCFSGWSTETLKYHLLSLIHCWTDSKWKSTWCWHIIFRRLGLIFVGKNISFFTSIGPQSRTSQFWFKKDNAQKRLPHNTNLRVSPTEKRRLLVL